MYKEKIAAVYPSSNSNRYNPFIPKPYYEIQSFPIESNMRFNYILYNVVPGKKYSIKFEMFNSHSENFFHYILLRNIIPTDHLIYNDNLCTDIQQITTPIIGGIDYNNKDYKLKISLYYFIEEGDHLGSLLDEACTYISFKKDEFHEQ